jgi:hypothetical protein
MLSGINAAWAALNATQTVDFNWTTCMLLSLNAGRGRNKSLVTGELQPTKGSIMKSLQRLTRFAIPALLLPLVVAESALAQDCSKIEQKAQRIQSEIPERFTAVDVDRDGRVTRDELAGAHPNLVRHFDQFEAVKKQGYFTLTQAQDYARNRAAKRLEACRKNSGA